jgi:hypothetical protein
MALLLLPFFMPLFLIGWVLTPRHERELRLATKREREAGEVWRAVFASESQVMERDELWPH